MMHVSGRGRGISELDLAAVFATEEERSALTLVKSLDLSHNLLVQVSALHPLGSLEVLNVSHNKIHSMRSLPLTLVRLDVSFNQLSSIDGLGSLPCLEELDVSHNRLHSLDGLSTSSTTLRVLKASGNRIATTSGLEKLIQLRVLLLDKNLVASADELLCVGSMVQLEVVSFAESPVTSINGYREYMARLQPHALSIDGSPNVHHQQPRTAPNFKAPPAAANRTSHSAQDASAGRDHNLSYTGGGAGNTSGGHSQNTSSVKPLPSADASGLSEEAVRTLKRQLQESRRLIREQLEELAALREERAAHVEQMAALKAKADRLQRNAKYEKERHHLEMSRLEETYERNRTVSDVHISDLRQRMADATVLSAAHHAHDQSATSLGRRSQQQHLNNSRSSGRHHAGTTHRADETVVSDGEAASPPEATGGGARVTSEVAGALAKQLKEWLCAEVQRQTTNDAKRGGTSKSTPSPPAVSDSSSDERADEAAVEAHVPHHSPRSAAKHITALWRRNEERIGKLSAK